MTTSATGSSSPLFTSKQRVTGLANGAFNTQSIVENLMSIERQPYDKLDIKRQTEQLRLQAYQAVNTYLLNFRNSVSTLSSRTLWNSKTTTSTNEKSLLATANEYAVKGSYSFKVAQLATAAQFRSKGVVDSKAPLAPAKKTKDAEGKEITAPPEKLGTINLASGKSRVDNSAKLEQLNGGKGVFRGSIRITDSNNGSANIDISACITLDDVIRTINETNGVRVNASMRDGSLYIEDEADGASTLKIQNVGAGTAATDLGIAGTDVDKDGNKTGFIHGRNVYTLGRDMALSMLNDGLGVEEGNINMRIFGQNSNGEPSYVEIIANVDGCKTVGDVIDRVNKEIENLRDNGFENPAHNVAGAEPEHLLKNLRFGISSDGTSFGFTGVTDANSFSFFDTDNPSLVGQTKPAEQLGLTGTWTVESGAREVSFGRVLGDANSPMLKNLGGAGGDGVGSNTKYPVKFDGNTKVSALNQGNGIDTTTGLQFIMLEGGKSAGGIETSATPLILTDVIDMNEFRAFLKDGDLDDTNGLEEPDVDDLVEYLNKAIEKYANDPTKNGAGLKGMEFKLDVARERIVIAGVQPGYSIQIAGGIAKSLDLTRARNSDGTAGTAIENLDSETRAAVDNFYGMDGNNVDIRASGSNDDLVMSGEGATKLGDLGVDWRSVFGSGEGVTVRLANGRNDNGTPDDPSDDDFAWNYDADNTTPDWDDPLSVTVRWEDLELLDENGDPLEINEDTELGALVEAMNKALAEKFSETVQDVDGTTKFDGHVPQIRMNSFASGLQWSNMDFDGQYWSMEDAGSGGGLEALGLKRDFSESVLIAESVQAESSGSRRLDPRQTAYAEAIVINKETAESVRMGELIFGTGISLLGGEEDTVDILFKPNTAAEGEADNSEKISFSMKELNDAVGAYITAWNLDAANAGNPKSTVNDLTIDEYMGVLNKLVDDKIAEHYDGSGVAEEDQFSIDFGVGDGTFIVENIKNSDGLTIDGNGTDSSYGFISGIMASRYTQEQIDAAADADREIVVNFIGGTAGVFHPQEIEGLGQIFFTIDGDDDYADIIRLDTDGLDQSSTLNDLIDKLNKELAERADDLAASGEPEKIARAAVLREMSFKVNTSGTGIALDNGSNARIAFIDTFQLKEGGVDENGDPITDDDKKKRLPDAQRLAQDLGLVGPEGETKVVEAYSYYNAKSLQRNYISRATSLESLLGKQADYGTIAITNAGGNTLEIPLADAKTIGDVIDFINSRKGFGVFAELNDAGDGIRLREAYEGELPPADKRQGQISVSDVAGGINIAKKIGLAGTGKREDDRYPGASVSEGGLSTEIEVMSTDSLEDLMFRISEAGYKTAVINDGTAWRLTVSATNTGEAYDFVIDTDVEQLGFTQSYRGADAKVLQGDPNATSSPLMLSSPTNSNSNAISGLTLDIKGVSSEWTTITIDDDKEQVTEAIKSMVTAYNELSQIIKMLDAYDQETGEEGILFGDDNVRTLMDDISEFFYEVYNPNNASLGALDKDGKQQTWTWMDLGINLSAEPSNADGSGGWYNQIDLDEDKLTDMVASKWDVLSKMLWNEQNVSSINVDENVKPTASFNGDLEDGFTVDDALNGNISKTSFGSANGIQAKDTIENGDDEYTIWFQKASILNRMTVYFPSAETSLKDFTVEYLDVASGQWKELRHPESNSSDYVSFGFMNENINASAVRIKANSTNAEDGKFRLLDVQIYEQAGLAGKMNKHTTTLGDTQVGFLASMNEEIQASLTEIEDQMQSLQDKLTAKEESLWRRFSAMETAMNKLKGQGDYFSNMMKSMGSSS